MPDVCVYRCCDGANTFIPTRAAKCFQRDAIVVGKYLGPFLISFAGHHDATDVVQILKHSKEVPNFSDGHQRIIVLTLDGHAVHIAGNLIFPVHINLMLAPGLALQLHIVLNSRWFKNIIVNKLLVKPLCKALKLGILVHVVSIIYSEVTQNSVNLHIIKLEKVIMSFLDD